MVQIPSTIFIIVFIQRGQTWSNDYLIKLIVLKTQSELFSLNAKAVSKHMLSREDILQSILFPTTRRVVVVADVIVVVDVVVVVAVVAK